VLAKQNPGAAVPALLSDAMCRPDTGQEDRSQGREGYPKSGSSLPRLLGQQGARLQEGDEVAAPSPRVNQREKDQKQRQLHRIANVVLSARRPARAATALAPDPDVKAKG